MFDRKTDQTKRGKKGHDPGCIVTTAAERTREKKETTDKGGRKSNRADLVIKDDKKCPPSRRVNE